MRWENINEWRGFNYYFGNLHLDWNIKVWHIIVAIFVCIVAYKWMPDSFEIVRSTDGESLYTINLGYEDDEIYSNDTLSSVNFLYCDIGNDSLKIKIDAINDFGSVTYTGHYLRPLTVKGYYTPNNPNGSFEKTAHDYVFIGTCKESKSVKMAIMRDWNTEVDGELEPLSAFVDTNSKKIAYSTRLISNKDKPSSKSLYFYVYDRSDIDKHYSLVMKHKRLMKEFLNN